MKRVFDPARHCGAKTKHGPCCAWKGQGTTHVGAGQCSNHGGCTPNGRKAGAKEAALTFARGALGAAVSVSPIDAMAESVMLAGGLVDYYRHEVAKAAMADPVDTARIDELRPQYVDAIKLEKDCAKAALDAGVAERQQRLAERQALLLAAAIADGLREVFGELATVERRTAFAKVVGQRLLVLEHEDGDPLVVASTGRRIAV